MESFLTNNRFQSIILDRSVKTQQKKKMKRKNPWTTNNTVVYKNIQQLSVGECFSVLPVICTVLLFLLLIIKKNNEDRFETKARETKSIHGLFFLQSFFFHSLGFFSSKPVDNEYGQYTGEIECKSKIFDFMELV